MRIVGVKMVEAGQSASLDERVEEVINELREHGYVPLSTQGSVSPETENYAPFAVVWITYGFDESGTWT